MASSKKKRASFLGLVCGERGDFTLYILQTVDFSLTMDFKQKKIWWVFFCLLEGLGLGGALFQAVLFTEKCYLYTASSKLLQIVPPCHIGRPIPPVS